MAKEPPQTIGDMRRKAINTDEEISAAIEAFLANPGAAMFEFASGRILDVWQAVKEHRPAKAVRSGKMVSE